MQALISGQAGLGLLLDGDDVWSVTVDAPHARVPCARASVLHVFGGASDVQSFASVTENQAVDRLQQAWRIDRALQLTLILLDHEDDEETRVMAAECIEEFFQDLETRDFVANRLFAAPLPIDADLRGAILFAQKASAAALISFLEQLDSRQLQIAQVRTAWKELDPAVFGDTAGRRRFEVTAIQCGLFRRFVEAKAAGNVDHVLITGLQDQAIMPLPHFRNVLMQWATPWKEQSLPKPPVARDESVDADSLYEVAVPGASIDVSDWSDLSEGAIVEGRITGANTGGLECMVNNIRGFIPCSQVGMYRVENFAEYIGQKLPCVVTEVNPRRRNLVLSHRAFLERQREESRKQLIEEMAPGDVREGVVRSIRDFGAFVDLGGIDGMVHVSQISWDRVNHPSEVLKEGQKVRVKIEKINAQTGKISLSIRDLLDRPWDNIEQKFPVGTTVKGPVTRIAKFGAFVKLASGVEGLIHISEMAHQRIRAVSDVVQEGQEVEVKILSIDPEAQRIALSLKATLPPPEARVEEPEVEAQPQRESAIRNRKSRLLGGFDHLTGGEKFGLKW